MGFWSLLVVASMPVVEFLLIGSVGAFLASGYINILTADARRDVNKIVFYVFTPALIFAILAKTVTLREIISWWYMPVNIGLTFLIGAILGWLVVKILRTEPQLEGLVISCCSAGNLGNLLMIIVPVVCNQDRSPFGDSSICNERAMSYVSMSMALGGFYIWTYTYSLMKRMGIHHDRPSKSTMKGNDLLYSSTYLLVDEAHQQQMMVPLLSNENASDDHLHFCGKLKITLHQFAEELMTPSVLAAMAGFVVGLTPWLKSLIIGRNAPLHAIQDTLTVLGDGVVPCCTLVLGGNLTKGLRKSPVKLTTILGITTVRYLFLPMAGIAAVKVVGILGILPQDPMFHYVLLIQFALPPAMSIGTMAQLFDAGQEECSVIFLWTYLIAAPALTIWSTIFMYILS